MADRGMPHPVLVSEDFRFMCVPLRSTIIGCVGDRGAKRVSFEVPRRFGDVDLADFDVQVHFTGAEGTGDWGPALDVDVGEDVISFFWEPSRVAFEAEGVVRANVRMSNGPTVVNSGMGYFRVVRSLREDPYGSPLADEEGDLIVITVDEEE
jgi:hypothetical protein